MSLNSDFTTKIIELEQNFIKELSPYIKEEDFLKVFGEGRGIFFKFTNAVYKVFNNKLKSWLSKLKGSQNSDKEVISWLKTYSEL